MFLSFYFFPLNYFICLSVSKNLFYVKTMFKILVDFISFYVVVGLKICVAWCWFFGGFFGLWRNNGRIEDFLVWHYDEKKYDKEMGDSIVSCGQFGGNEIKGVWKGSVFFLLKCVYDVMPSLSFFFFDCGNWELYVSFAPYLDFLAELSLG